MVDRWGPRGTRPPGAPPDKRYYDGYLYEPSGNRRQRARRLGLGEGGPDDIKADRKAALIILILAAIIIVLLLVLGPRMKGTSNPDRTMVTTPSRTVAGTTSPGR